MDNNSTKNNKAVVDSNGIEVYDRHEQSLTSFLNPIRNSNFNSANFAFNSGTVNVVSLLFAILAIIIVIHAMYLSFNGWAFSFSLIILAAVFIIRPNVLDNLRDNPVLQYYCLFITYTLIMAIDNFKNNADYFFLIMINMILSVVSYLTQVKWFIAVSIYLNIYVLSLIAVVYRNQHTTTGTV